MPEVRTCLWFHGPGEEAARFYCSLLPDSRVEAVEPPWTVLFTLGGVPYRILSGGPMHTLTPAASISVTCDTQAEVDRLWSALTEGGEAGRCGWLVDRWGLSWQIVPEGLGRVLAAGNPKVQEAFMAMSRLDMAVLEAALEG